MSLSLLKLPKPLQRTPDQKDLVVPLMVTVEDVNLIVTVVPASSNVFIYIYFFLTRSHFFFFDSDNEKKVNKGWGEAGTAEFQG